MTTVLKLGGAVVDDLDTIDAIVKAWHDRQDANESWTLVHGGGIQLNDALHAVQGPPVKINGLRVTTLEGAAVCCEVLDSIGKTLANALIARGLPAAHIATDMHLLRAIEKRVPDGNIGRVGTPIGVDVLALTERAPPGTIAIVTPVGWDDAGPLNINADEAACAVAGALRAAQLVLATDVDHVLDGAGEAIRALDAIGANALIANGVAKGGMVPKLNSALMALTQGAQEVVIGKVRAAWNGSGTRVVAA